MVNAFNIEPLMEYITQQNNLLFTSVTQHS